MSNNLLLGDISDFINGGAWSDKVYVDEGHNVVRVTNMINGSIESKNDSFLDDATYKKYIKHKLNKGDLVIATVGSHPTQQGSVVGRTSVVPSKYDGALLNQNAVCIRILDKRVNQEFFNYLTKITFFKYHIESRAQGSANQVRMALSELKKFKFNYPSIDIQEKIVNLISNYDNLIENNNKRIKLLEEMAEEIYTEWFVKFRFPNYQNTKMVDGIPAGWEEKNAEKFFAISIGKTPPRKESQWFEDKESNENVKWVSIKDIGNSNIFNFESSEYLVNESISKFNIKVVPKGTLLLSFKLTIGKICITTDKTATNEAISHFVFTKENEFFREYLYLFFKNYKFQLLGNTSSIATAINSKIIKNMKILIPSMELVKKLSSLLRPIFNDIEILLQKKQNLKQTRDLLLPRLISGKLNIEDLDIK